MARITRLACQEAGPAPICAGFGSMLYPHSFELQVSILDGLRQAGQCLIILTGWDDWKAEEPGPDRLFLQDAPHGWLFSRCAAVLHHGGAGTAAAALRSGQPNLVLPLSANQFFWARRIHACGASPPPLSARNLSAGRVATAVRQALESESIRRCACPVSEAVRLEAG